MSARKGLVARQEPIDILTWGCCFTECPFHRTLPVNVHVAGNTVVAILFKSESERAPFVVGAVESQTK
jgi:hypothetical protein